MSQVVLDSSAILAFLQHEPGADKVLALVGRVRASAVNAAEVQTKLIRDGMPPEMARAALLMCVQSIVAFDAAQGELAAGLALQTRDQGLSLGDRACLALGQTRDLSVLTADAAWTRLSGFRVTCIR